MKDPRWTGTKNEIGNDTGAVTPLCAMKCCLDIIGTGGRNGDKSVKGFVNMTA